MSAESRHGVRRGSLLLRWGLPRDPAAVAHLAGFFVATVLTVLVTRGLLAASGYPQIGGGGLHIAHVLIGGVLMALAFVLMLSFVGPVVRPLGALVGGIGFGLFVDEIGKFVTSDNDYFYEPAAALIYIVIVVLVIVADALHGRTAPRGAEALAGAVDHAVAGVAGGFSTRARYAASQLIEDAGDAPGAAEVRALLDQVAEDADELPNPIGAVAAWAVATSRRVVREGWAPWVAIAVLSGTGLVTVGRGMLAWFGDQEVPGWVVGGMLASGLVSLGCSAVGLVRVRADARSGYVWFRRAVLISLLLTQIFLFRLDQWAAVAGLAVDLLVLGVVAAELSVMASAGLDRSGRMVRTVRSDPASTGQP